MVRADPGQFRPVVNRQGRSWHWLPACDIPLSETEPTPRVGHDPTAHDSPRQRLGEQPMAGS